MNVFTAKWGANNQQDLILVLHPFVSYPLDISLPLNMDGVPGHVTQDFSSVNNEKSGERDEEGYRVLIR